MNIRMNVVGRVERLFREYGNVSYDGARAESVSALAHALQCAQLAEAAYASAEVVAAALLHDVGHFLPSATGSVAVDHLDDAHEQRAVPFLSEDFGSDVVEPVRLHVQAKRYLVAVDAGYAATLSPASVHSLRLQGGPMSREQVLAFEALPYATDAIALRRWDDLAKEPGRATPPLCYYLALLEEVRLQD